MKTTITLTKKEFLAKLTELQKSGDTEVAHAIADEMLCAFLRSIGHANVADAFEKIRRWYA